VLSPKDTRAAIHGVESMLFYWPDFISAKESWYFFNILLNETKWYQENISFWGKSTPVPRLTSWHSQQNKSYSYSGVVNPSNSYSKTLYQLHQMIENLTQLKFNSVLLNLYRDGEDSMGWHSDDEVTLDQHASIASLSLGAARDFQIKPKDKSRKLSSIKLETGSLLVMKSPFQEKWLHRIPRRKNIHESRINLTFRQLL